MKSSLKIKTNPRLIGKTNAWSHAVDALSERKLRTAASTNNTELMYNLIAKGINFILFYICIYFWYFVCKIVLKNFWNFQKIWDQLKNLFKQWKVRTIFETECVLTCSWRFLRSNMYIRTILVQNRKKNILGFRNLLEKFRNIPWFLNVFINVFF